MVCRSKLTCRQQGNNLCMGSKEGLKVVEELSGKLKEMEKMILGVGWL